MSDTEILRAAIRRERELELAYAGAAPKLDADTAHAAEQFGKQAREHRVGLVRVLEDLGGRAPRLDQGPIAQVPDGRRKLLSFLESLESSAVAAWYGAHARLRSAEALKTATRIMANEAQHLVVLRQALGEDPAPDAFVTGRAP